MIRRLPVLLFLAGLGCGGSQRPGVMVPQSESDALTQFMSAVKAKDLARMGELWGNERGPAASYMSRDRLRRQLTTIQIYLDHTGYRVLEGPVPAQPLNPTFQNLPSADRLRDMRIEFQRANGCRQLLPITLVRTNSGGWLVYDVHLESAGNPAVSCEPRRPGTRR